MNVRLSELAAMVRGKLVGDRDPVIEGAAVLGEATLRDITLVDHADKLSRIEGTIAAAAIVPQGVQHVDMPVVQVGDVHEAFATIVEYFRPPRRKTRGGISPAAHISPTARIAADVEIGPAAVIDDEVEIGSGCVIHPGARIMAGSRIGEQTTIHSGAVLYEGTVVGPRCTIHAGAVIGCFGFGYRLVDGRHKLSAQLGHVRIEADVEIGANSTIDRGSYGATVIGEGTKIDNQVQIGHNCRIGRHNLLCAQVGIAGSTTTGDYVVMAGQVGVRDHVHIGQGAVLGAMAGISNDVPPGSRMIGIPATPEREQKVKQAALAKLPEMRKELKALAAAVARIEATLGGALSDVGPQRRGEAA
jgi:UDP-3-O-[3-hydroxymyristoyl] glucosamine N-acyltransferase